MTPLEIGLLLDIHCTAAPLVLPSPVHEETIKWFLKEGLIEEYRTQPGRYTTLPRGAYFVERLCALPLPISVWVIPQEGE